ncbi:MAG: energy transducer TonB [Bacteroidales bacterium]|nr:energy transducer TonB [Bacteroidales bacterium]
MRKEDKAGIQITIIFHLVVLIVLLVMGIGHQLVAENSFVLDFTKQEEKELELKKLDFQEDISKRLDDMISQAQKSNPIRNVATSNNLTDDRHSAAEAKALMNDAARLAADLKAGYKSDIEEDARAETVDIRPKDQQKEGMEYKGPSVLSWTLEGRKASHLPIPAYRCYGAGNVTVAIVVDQQGKVVNAKINEAESASDECLRNFAIRAARLSRFSKSTTAPLRQAGEIVYAFIAQ